MSELTEVYAKSYQAGHAYNGDEWRGLDYGGAMRAGYQFNNYNWVMCIKFTLPVAVRSLLFSFCNDTDGYSERSVFDIGYDVIKLGDLAPNGAQLRPHIVWFGEAVPYINAAIDHVESADVLLIVGTSLKVYPAAGLYSYAKADTPIYIIDPKEVSVRDGRITHIKDVATKGMETFKNMVK